MTPAPPDLRFMAALKARRQGDVPRARQLLEELLAAEPEHADALEVLGMLCSEQGEQDRAIGLTERLAALRPDSIMAHANLSRFFMLKGDKPTAEEWQAKARVLGWREEVARKAAAGGATGGLDGGVDPAQVERQERAVAEHPDDALARLALARSYSRLGMPARAIGHLQRALDLDATLSNVYLELGRSLEATGNAGQAAEIYQKGIPIADRRGDLMPRNQMASRLAVLRKDDTG